MFQFLKGLAVFLDLIIFLLATLFLSVGFIHPDIYFNWIIFISAFVTFLVTGFFLAEYIERNQNSLKTKLDVIYDSLDRFCKKIPEGPFQMSPGEMSAEEYNHKPFWYRFIGTMSSYLMAAIFIGVLFSAIIAMVLSGFGIL